MVPGQKINPLAKIGFNLRGIVAKVHRENHIKQKLHTGNGNKLTPAQVKEAAAASRQRLQRHKDGLIIKQ